MQAKTPRLRRIQWIAMTFLTLAGIVNYLDRSTLSIANHSVSGELGLSASQMGLLLSAFSFSYAFSQLPMGALLDRFGARLMLGVGMLVWSVAQLFGGFVHEPAAVPGCADLPRDRRGAAVSRGRESRQRMVFAARARPAYRHFHHLVDHRPGPRAADSHRAAARVRLALDVHRDGRAWALRWRSAGTSSIATAREVTLEPEEVTHLTEEEPHARAERRMTGAEWRGLFASRTTWGMIFGFMGVIYMVWLYLTWLPAYLEHERHLSIAKTGWIVSIPYLFGTLGMLSSGFVADGLMARGIAPIRSRKWPICTGLIFARRVHGARRLHAEHHARDRLSVAGDVLHQHGERRRVGTRQRGRAAAPGGVARQHPELRRLLRRVVRAVHHRRGGRPDAFVRRRLPDQRGRRRSRRRSSTCSWCVRRSPSARTPRQPPRWPDRRSH